MTVMGKMDLIGVETSMKALEEDIAHEVDAGFHVQVTAERYYALCSALIEYAERYEGYKRHAPEVLTAMCFMTNNDEGIH